MLSLMVTAIPSLTAPECAAGFVEAQLNLRQFELYPTWFDDNSSLTLAQTGVYEGVDDIEEFTIDIVTQIDSWMSRATQLARYTPRYGSAMLGPSQPRRCSSTKMMIALVRNTFGTSSAARPTSPSTPYFAQRIPS